MLGSFSGSRSRTTRSDTSAPPRVRGSAPLCGARPCRLSARLHALARLSVLFARRLNKRIANMRILP